VSAEGRCRIVIVGPCASGKSVLVNRLCALGYDAHECAQEHSEVAAMWRRLIQPDVLIYLDAALATIRQRRAIDWEADYLAKLNHRLRDARAHCDFYLATDGLSEVEVLEAALQFLTLSRQRSGRS
jgi:deoxyadenosine/deoxycytidine kinase